MDSSLCVCSDCNTCCLPIFVRVSCVGKQIGVLSGCTKEKTHSTQVGSAPMVQSSCTACCIVTLITCFLSYVHLFLSSLSLLFNPTHDFQLRLTPNVALVIAYQRYRVRQLYDIQGNAVCDLMAAYCCHRARTHELIGRYE